MWLLELLRGLFEMAKPTDSWEVPIKDEPEPGKFEFKGFK
jgi:hypothetical protein